MFLKNKNIIFKIRRSKVTDYAALRVKCCLFCFADEEVQDSEIELDEKIFCNKIGPCGCELIHR